MHAAKVTLCGVVTTVFVTMAGCNKPAQQRNQDQAPPDTQPGTMVRAISGGTVALGPVTLMVPPRSLSQDTVIGLEQQPLAPDGVPGDFKPAGPAFRFTPAGTQFALDRPAILTMPYNVAALQEHGLDARTVQLAYFDEALGIYQSVGGILDPETGLITARIEHFTLYTVIAASLVPGNNAPTIAPQGPIPATMRAGAPIYLRALVRDYDSGGSVAGAWLHYRLGSAGPYQVVPMKAEPTLDVFSAMVPASAAVINAGDTDLQYYFSARDNLGATRTTLTAGTSLPTSVEFTQSYQTGTLLLNSTSTNMAAGFEKLLTFTARDQASVSFALVPESTSVTGGVGEASIGSTGVTFRARSVGAGTIHAGFGAETAASPVVVQNGALSRVVILDEHGLPIEGTRVVSQGVRVQLDALGEDAWGNTVLVTPAWGVDAQLGSISAGGVLDTLDAAASGQVTATVGSVVGVQWFVVTPRVLKSRLMLGPTPPAALTALGQRNNIPYAANAQHDGSKYVLQVRHLNGGVWVDDGGPVTTQDVDSVVLAGSSNRLQVAWVEGTHVRSAHLEGNVWLQDGGDLTVSSTVVLGHAVNRLSLAMDGDTPWLAWHEAGGLGTSAYVARWDGTGWSLVGGRLNAPGSEAMMPSLAMVGAVPHVATVHTVGGGVPQVVVQRWNGAAWEALGGSLNSLVTGQADNPALAVVDGRPTVAFRNTFSANSYRLFVRQWDGAAWGYLCDPVAGVPSSGFDLLSGVSAAADGAVTYLAVSEGVSQADATARYRLMHHNPFTNSWVNDAVGPVYAPGSGPAFMDTSVALLGGRIWQARSEPNGVEHILAFEVTIRDVAPTTLVYLDDDASYVVGAPIVANVPAVTGGLPSNYSVTPPLPLGLTLDALTGIITGTPLVEQARTRHTVRAENTAGALDAVLHIEVLAPAPGTLTYAQPEVTCTDGTAITPNLATVSGGGSFTFSVSPVLPQGLVLDAGTGTISGTPRVVVPRSPYLITAASSGGAATATLHITVNAAPPASLAYAPANLVAVVGQALSPVHPVITGGTPTAFTVTPALPPGVTLHALTGVVSGTPTLVTAAQDYTVSAINVAGGATATLRLEVVHAPPTSLAYGQVTAVYRVGQPATPNLPTTPTPGGAYTVVPVLPPGLVLDAASGAISGTPSAEAPGATYTVTVSTASGSASTVLSITVLPVAPVGLSYAASVAVYRPGEAIAPNAPTLTGGVATSYSASPGLPAGLVLDPITGIITGTPNGPIPQTDYVVTASNAGGSTTAVLRITIRDAAPQGLTYGQLTPVYGVGQPITPNVATLAAGTGASFAITPALPPGLTFDTSTGRISGTPSVLYPAAQHTVTASNTEGASTVTLIITVVEAPPVGLVYSQPDAQYVFNTFAGPNIPSFAGGAATGFSIAPALSAGLTFDTATGIISGVPTQLSPPTLYTVTVTNTAGSTTGTVTITVGQPPVILTFPPVYTTVNEGDDATFFANAAGEGPLHYAWAVNGNAVGGDSSSLTLSSVTPALDLAQVWVQVSSPFGSTTAQVGTLGVIPLPAATISAPSVVYRGDAVTVSVPGQGGSTYAWTATAGAFQGATNTASVVWSLGNLGSATLQVTVTNATGQTASTTASIQTVERATADLFVARDRVLPGTRAIPASVVPKAGLTYAWSVGVPTGAAGLTLTGSSTSNVTKFDVGPGKGSVPLSVTVTDALGATATRTRTVVVDGGFFMPAISHHMATPRAGFHAIKLKDGRVLAFGETTPSTSGPAHAELFDPLTNTWGQTGPMLQRRVAGAAALMDDGRVVVSGGRNNTGTSPLGSAEIYDPASNTWSALPGMRALRLEHTLTALPGNRVLAIGGLSGLAAASTLSSTEIYDAGLNRWDLSTPMPWPRRAHSANRMASGEVVIAGGYDNGNAIFESLDAFDASLQTWRSVTSHAGLRRVGHAAAVVQLPGYGDSNGEVLVMVGGGTDINWANACQSNGQFGYAIATRISDGVEVANNCGIAVHNESALGVMADGTLVMAGGYNGQLRADTYVFNLPSGSLTPIYAGNLRRPRSGAQLVGLDDGRGMVVGGYLTGPGATTSTVEFFGGSEWGPPGRIGQARDRHQAVPLANGDVLLFGGDSRSGVTASAELYNAQTHQLRPVAPMPVPAVYGRGSRLADGRVLVTGGLGASSLAHASVFDPSAGVWSAAEPMTVARYGHVQVTLADGRVLVMGGAGAAGGYLASTEMFEPALNVWTAGPNMMEERYLAGAVTLADGAVLVCGGVSASTCERFDPSSNTFSAAPALPATSVYHLQGLHMFRDGNRVVIGPSDQWPWPMVLDLTTGLWAAGATGDGYHPQQGATMITGGRLVVFGVDRYVRIYDVTSNTWSDAMGPVGIGRTQMPVFAAGDEVVAVGGYNATVGHLGSVSRFNVNTGVVEDGDNLPLEGLEGFATAMNTGEVLFGGGVDNVQGETTRVQAYDPATQHVREMRSMPQTQRLSTAHTLDDGRVLVVGGRNQGTALALGSLLFQPGTQTWTDVPMAQPRYYHASVKLLDGRVVALGGYRPGYGALADVEVFDPATASWTPGAGLLQARYVLGATLLQDGRVLLAGGYSSAPLDVAEIWDPVTGSSSIAPLPTAASEFPMVTLTSGEALGVGGFVGTASADATSTFNASTGSWTTSPGAPFGQYGGALLALPGAGALLFGGHEYSALGYLHLNESAVLDASTLPGAWSPGPSLHARRVWMGVVTAEATTVIAGGGAVSLELFAP